MTPTLQQIVDRALAYVTPESLARALRDAQQYQRMVRAANT